MWAGYRVSSTHANPLGLKTDAPPHVMWDIMRCWVSQHGSGKTDPDSYAGIASVASACSTSCPRYAEIVRQLLYVYHACPVMVHSSRVLHATDP